jgi:hypothetical protein
MSRESIVHGELERRAAAFIGAARTDWKKDRKVGAYAVAWPSEELKADDGKSVTHAVYCAIPPEFDAGRRMKALQQLIERTKAYGLVFVEQREHSIHILFETSQGSRGWRVPLSWHGDVQVPGQTEASDECIGLLFRKGPTT